MKYGLSMCIFSNWDCAALALRVTGAYVDHIYLSYSDKPWGYNQEARRKYQNTFKPEDIKGHPHEDKITLIKGEWDTEEAQRNACYTGAKDDRCDILIIQDADEFYMADDFVAALECIKADNPKWGVYTVPYIVYWKSHEWVIKNQEGGRESGRCEFALRMKNIPGFLRHRQTKGTKTKGIDCVQMHHASMIVTDKMMRRKIETWAHTNEFDRESWLENIWHDWVPGMKDLHHFHPEDWHRAEWNTTAAPVDLAEWSHRVQVDIDRERKGICCK